jgi:hypothetical protein
MGMIGCFLAVSDDDFKAVIYPQIWDEPKEECIEYITSNFGDLKKFVQETADSDSALIVYIG